MNRDDVMLDARTIFWKVVEPHERQISCDARRGPRSRICCEMPALHGYGNPFPGSSSHAGRSVVGAWFSWPVESEKP